MLNVDISFSYGDGKEIFNHFSFSAGRGEKLRIIAPPGSGKTTLAKILTGSVPSYSGGTLSGNVNLDGNPILDLDAAHRMPLIGRVNQNTDEMMLFSSVEEEIAFPLCNLGLDDEEIGRRIKRVLSMFSLEKLEKASTSELSGGEKRRLMLSILFAVDPEVYLLDESFDELSPEWRRKLSCYISESERTFIILGSHELEEMTMISGPVISIGEGRAVPYKEETLPCFSCSKRLSETSLTASGLVIRRRHKGLPDSDSFMLSVPSFSIKAGECIVITGDNGAGKSSLSRVLCGLLREDEGRVLFNGRNINAKERRKTVAYLMQNPYEELFLPTVMDEAKSTGCGKVEIEKALSLFGLEGNWYTAEISYGKAKLLQALLFYLLNRPFAIFDEFDSALPYSESLKAVRLYLERGSGVIVITHDMNFASILPGRHIKVKEGVLYEC